MDTKIAKINEESILLCPYCSHEYLHHESVEVFWRESEDSERGVRVSSEKGRTNVYSVLEMHKTKNPSGRRDGLRIILSCEGCNNYSFFYISQHKGRTFLEQNEKLDKQRRGWESDITEDMR